MEARLGQDAHPLPIDKSIVLNVKPLRRLAPIFPSATDFNSSDCTPFDSGAAYGSFPPGFAPVYASFVSPEGQRHPERNQQTPMSDAVPITSFRSQPMSTAAGIQCQNSQNDTGIEDTGNGARRRGRPRKRKNGTEESQKNLNFAFLGADVGTVANNIITNSVRAPLDTARQADGDKETVGSILTIYHVLRRKITQIEEPMEVTRGAKQPALKSGKIMMQRGIRTNARKRIGNVPGVEVGDIFFFRIEMCLVGLHAQCMAGIDALKSTQEEDSVAISIVSSGGYEDSVDDRDALIYTGHGGHNNYNDKEASDQKLERGNLALEKSLHRANEVRVIRGMKDASNPTGKIYVYDGLYRIRESWVEKGKSGFNQFKYKLLRLPGQPEAFTMWKSIQQWKEGVTSRQGVIVRDLTASVESLPVSLFNCVDDEKGPAHFTYHPGLKYLNPVTLEGPSVSCNCASGCLVLNNCPCMQKNGGYLPYNTDGVLVSQKPMIHECGASCNCPPTCRNRLSQGGLKFFLEVFKTKDRGWGLRSWDPIRAGAFICEYAGEVIDKSKLDELRIKIEDNYIFDTTRTYQPRDVLTGDANGAPKVPFPLIISAKNVGNVSRFMNHSCLPNVFWQPVLRNDGNMCNLHITFHAIRNIPPMTELTYDYGIVIPDQGGSKKKCLCGSVKCRGYFY